ncbi:MAG: HD domain-containing protein [Actinobacteria bacterium]|nr:HD domain-containing protein [Actinomycetota bacterium]
MLRKVSALFDLSPADRRGAYWAVLLAAMASGVGTALLVTHSPLPSFWALAVLAAVAALAERQAVWLTERIQTSVSFLPLVFAAVAFGPLAAFIVGGASHAVDFRRPYLRWAVYTPVRALTGASAGFAAAQVGAQHGGFTRYLAASLVASFANILSDGIFNCLTLLVRGSSGWAFAKTMLPLCLVYVPLYVPMVSLFVYGYYLYSFWIVIAFLVPALALQRLVHLYQEQRDASRHLEGANARLRSANLSFATALVATLDARDRYTAGHSAAVAIYARDIAARMGLSAADQELVHLAGLVHDVGKIGLPAGLLEKPGALTLEERRQMERHSEIGEQILRNVEDYSEIASIVRHHHERVDGLGYPDGLGGSEIPLLSRVIAVADSYNAMTSDRPYREALPSRVARLRLAQAVESQFDTSVVAAFEAILAAADEAYRMGKSADFALTAPRRDDEETTPSLRVASVAI